MNSDASDNTIITNNLKKIVLDMVESNIDIKMIIQATGLSIDEITRIKNSI